MVAMINKIYFITVGFFIETLFEFGAFYTKSDMLLRFGEKYRCIDISINCLGFVSVDGSC